MLKKIGLALAVVALVALASTTGAFARLQTTGPGHTDTVQARLYDDHVTVSKATFLRGDSVYLVVTNLGTKPMRLKFGALSTPLIKPHKKAILLLVMDIRGRFPMLTFSAGGRVASVYMRIT